MDFFLSIDGEKQGPFGILKVVDLVQSGEIDRDTLGWHRGLDGWKPLHEIPALETVLENPPTGEPDPPREPPAPSDRGPEETFPGGTPLPAAGPVTAAAAAVPAQPPRPLRRFWARMFDYTLVSVLVFVFSDFAFPEPAAGESFADLFARYLEQMQSEEARLLARTQFFALIGWHLLESVLIHLVGTTPGKALLGITVLTADRYRIPLLRSLGRTVFVYILGVGFYLFPFNVLGMTFSFFRIMTTGQCLWDQQLGLTVECNRLSPVRIGLAIFAFFVLLMLQSANF